jgi:hypothetical protein
VPGDREEETVKQRLGLVVFLAVFAVGLAGVAAAQGPRQYYSGWSFHSRNRYYYRSYYYKPTPTYTAFRHHYALYFPTRAQHVYFYNPYRKVYWGRCPARYEGEPGYSMLAEADRKPRLDEIPETAFPKPGAPPPIPDSTDNVRMDLPPDDLPTDVVLPAAAGAAR